MARHQPVVGQHQAAGAEHAAGLPRRLPAPRLAARAASRCRHLRGRTPRPHQRAPAVRPGVGHGPARIGRQPCPPPDRHGAEHGRGADRDRPARRRCLHPGVQPDHRRQRRRSLPALPQPQNRSRAADPGQRQGRRRHQIPARARPQALAGRDAMAVPRHRRQRRRIQALLPRDPSSPSCAAGRTTSTCATKPARRPGSPPTASATLSGPGSSTPASPSTSCRSCSATPAPR